MMEASVSLWRIAGMAQCDSYAVVQQPRLTCRRAQFYELEVNFREGSTQFRNEFRQHRMGEYEHVSD